MSEEISLNIYNNARPDTWLNEFARSVTSQGGEDGIIEKILEVIGEINRWCVEFGSWDGKKLSNTFNLITGKEYSAVLIEGNSKRFKELLKTFEGNEKVIPLNAFIGFDKENSLDVLLKAIPIPTNFDVLSIDIDGNDYHIWEAVKDYRPKVVIIEFNPTVPSVVEFVQPRDMSVTQGAGLLSITKLAKAKGYELLAVESANAIFVDEKYFELFSIKDNSVNTIWTTDQFTTTHIFFGYDGTVFLRGLEVHPWQNIAIDESKMQLLPKWARKRVGDRNILRRKLGRCFRRLRKKNII